MAFKKGESGNPSGRPPKSRALSDMLEKTLAKTIPTSEGKISGKRVLASLVVEGITTGKVTFPGEDQPSTISVKDWIEFVKWAYQYLEPPITKQELTGANGEPFVTRVIVEYADDPIATEET